MKIRLKMNNVSVSAAKLWEYEDMKDKTAQIFMKTHIMKRYTQKKSII